MAESYVYLSFDGITGENTLAANLVAPGPGNGWTMLTGCEFKVAANTVGRAMATNVTSRIDLGGEAPPIVITKVSDRATVGLMREMTANRAPRQAVIAFTRTDTDGPTEYLRYELEGCSVVGFSFNGAGDNRTVETFKLHYGQITIIAYASGHGAKGGQSSVMMMNGG